MISCNSCPTPQGCKDWGSCLNTEVNQRSVRLVPFATGGFINVISTPINKDGWVSNAWLHSKEAVIGGKEIVGGWVEETATIPADAWAKIKPASCWHSYPPAVPGAIVTIRKCINCGQPEY